MTTDAHSTGPETRRSSGWIRFAVALFVAFATLTLLVVTGWTQPLDDALNIIMEDGEVAWLVAVAQLFHHVGAITIALPTAVVVTIAFAVLANRRTAVAWVAMVAGAQILSISIKAMVGRSRPMNTLVHESSAAFPSGHSMVSGAAMAIGAAILLAILWPGRYRLFLGLGVAYAVAMAWSRLYLRAHWLTDVAGGLILGTAVVLTVAWILTRRITNVPE